MLKYRKKSQQTVQSIFPSCAKCHRAANPRAPFWANPAQPGQIHSISILAFASLLTSFAMTHCNFLIKKLILGVKCQEKTKKKSLFWLRLYFFLHLDGSCMRRIKQCWGRSDSAAGREGRPALSSLPLPPPRKLPPLRTPRLPPPLGRGWSSRLLRPGFTFKFLFAAEHSERAGFPKGPVGTEILLVSEPI